MNFNQSNIKKAKKHLDNNRCIAVPTETVYGLAANAHSSLAVKKIFKLKKRPISNPLIVHYQNLKSLKEDCIINNTFLRLYNKFCPGPITFVLKLRKNSKISKFVTNNKKTLAIRFPKHKILKKLLKILNYPLAAPSANISTRLSSVQTSDVVEEFGNKISYVLEGGKSKIGIESTIIDLVNKPQILRLGALEVSKIEKFLKQKIKINNNPSKKIAPGQSKLHYSPGIPIKMKVSKPLKNQAYILLKKRNTKSPHYFYISKNINLVEAAKNLYSCLRKIKNRGYKSIAIEKISNTGLGKSINDRLNRASKF
ncbi:L-threonylcarbamoyladenylate synthase [Candidatus Pelagibacter sp.]|nr:L-threonylcarbamoyladenylate synthase [Candidatus Pelagibacter sp.]